MEYKLHIQTEHELDSTEFVKGVDPDLLSCENGYVLLKTKRVKSKSDLPSNRVIINEKNNSYHASLAGIKIEPVENDNNESYREEYRYQNKSQLDATPVRKAMIKTPRLKCLFCGLKCKGDKGLKIHMSAHKRSAKYSGNVPLNQVKTEKDRKLDETAKQVASSSSSSRSNVNPSLSNNVQPSFTVNANPSFSSNASPFFLPNNGFVNLGQNMQPGYIITLPQMQNQLASNFVSVGNNASTALNSGGEITSTQRASVKPNKQQQTAPKKHVKLPDGFQKFNSNSEEYMLWLKKFVSMCKLQTYPLKPDLCRTVSLITDEIAHALFNPVGALKQKSKHFYFMKMHTNLSDIMMKHLEHVFHAKV